MQTNLKLPSAFKYWDFTSKSIAENDNEIT